MLNGGEPLCTVTENVATEKGPATLPPRLHTFLCAVPTNTTLDVLNRIETETTTWQWLETTRSSMLGLFARSPSSEMSHTARSERRWLFSQARAIMVIMALTQANWEETWTSLNFQVSSLTCLPQPEAIDFKSLSRVYYSKITLSRTTTNWTKVLWLFQKYDLNRLTYLVVSSCYAVRGEIRGQDINRCRGLVSSHLTARRKSES